MIIRSLIASGLLCLMAGSADAADVCNETSFVVRVAAGWPVEDGVALEGWSRVRPGECAEIATGLDLSEEDNRPLYIYAKTSEAYLGGVREWRGGVPLCVDEADFALVANTRCSALGLASRDFMIRNGDQRERTVLVEPSDFGNRADDAGVQRLLQSAGYNINNIDGYTGPGTRRMITRFLSENGTAQRPSDERLIDMLEAHALERNAGSGLTVCNESRTDVSVALGHQVEDIWQSRGWWRLHNGECARMLASRLDSAGEAYFYATRINSDTEQTVRDGETGFCHAPSRFLAEGRDNCSDRGYTTALFRPIPEPEDGGVRVTLTDDDFGASPQ